jgi:Fe-S cluster biogenesis protein NfuA
MSRSDKEVIELIKDLIESRIQPAVSSHGGKVNFVSFEDSTLTLELSGACSGCAGSTMTLKYGIENIVKHYLPEVTSVEAIHDENSSVEPYYKDTQNVINTKEI